MRVVILSEGCFLALRMTPDVSEGMLERDESMEPGETPMRWHSLLDDTAIARLLPAEYAEFAKPICDGLALFLEGLPQIRQRHILAELAKLGLTADISARLGKLAQCSPVLQKIGQILARDQRLSDDLRYHLRKLESLPPSVPHDVIQQTLAEQLGPLERYGITLAPTAIAEASVAVVIPFTRERGSSSPQHGVFKVLKPEIEQQLTSELALLNNVGSYLDQRCDELGIPHLDYEESFQQVAEKLIEEIRLGDEQRHLVAAREFYAADPRVLIPQLFDCCTPRVTAMQRVWGRPITDHPPAASGDRTRLVNLLIDAIIARPTFAGEGRALFHSDPHGGNLFLTTDGRLAILDWSLVGWLEKQARTDIVQIMLAAALQDERRVVDKLIGQSIRPVTDHTSLHRVVRVALRKLRRGHLPGMVWLVGMLDDAVREAGLRVSADMMLFRKSLYTLAGVVAQVGDCPRERVDRAFDEVMLGAFAKQFVIEWPRRWLSLPHSRHFNTRLSNLDLTQAICGLPASVVRFWAAEVADVYHCQ